jgi:hypothetical protein
MNNNLEPIPFVGWVDVEDTFTYPTPTYKNAFKEREYIARLMDQARHLAQLAKQVEDYSELVYEATKLEQRIKEYEQSR